MIVGVLILVALVYLVVVTAARVHLRAGRRVSFSDSESGKRRTGRVAAARWGQWKIAVVADDDGETYMVSDARIVK